MSQDLNNVLLLLPNAALHPEDTIVVEPVPPMTKVTAVVMVVETP